MNCQFQKRRRNKRPIILQQYLLLRNVTGRGRKIYPILVRTWGGRKEYHAPVTRWIFFWGGFWDSHDYLHFFRLGHSCLHGSQFPTECRPSSPNHFNRIDFHGLFLPLIPMGEKRAVLPGAVGKKKAKILPPYAAQST